MRRPDGWWRRKSTPAKVETYTRWSFHFFAVAEFTTVGLPFTGATLWTGSTLWLPAMMLVHSTLCGLTASRALDWTRGRRPRPVRLLWALAAATVAVALAAIWITEHGPDREGVEAAAGAVFGISLIFGAGITALGIRERHRVFGVVNGFAAAAGLMVYPITQDGLGTLIAISAVVVGGGFLAFTCIFSVWLLDAVYQLDEARETRARLAVAEERLRFGRDLHDVMGRNLAVIALKAELAVQLARRGQPEAVEQMVEVQRIAQDSQREVREVVRGYREADLAVELAGAQGVLAAAGIDCEVRGEADGLPGEVQSALGWVVRETTTNVLRHGDAGRCSVGLSVAEGRVMLTVENDGAEATGHGDGRGGSGLAGLRERLRQVDGTLEAGFAGPGVFRVVAEVPLNRTGVVSEVTS
ncbi:histidine kinase [Streptomyces sp. NPDC005820]|uniref:sensor histidine kinase n=1 Tax=Streptomyces sp. NPDC005820 TaxID=3157069 RepID=UPI0033E3E874